MKTPIPPLAYLAIIALALLSGCKIVIETPEGGAVTSASGQNYCAPSSTCEIDVSDTYFSESFSAEAGEGYIFTGWEKRHKGFCGNSLNVCDLSTRDFGNSADLLKLLETDVTFYLQPRFGLASEHFVVDRVVDGDTLWVQDQNGKSIKVRLFGIDAPESDQPYGDKAELALLKLAGDQLVRMEIVGQDKNDRLIVNVHLTDGTYVNLSLVQQGLAWWYEYYAPSEAALEQAHREAQNNLRGLWADENPIDPYDWRNGVR